MALLLLWPLKAISQKLAKKKILPSAEELPKNQQLHVKIYTSYDRPPWILLAATLNSDIGLSLFLSYTLY
jgi:hypothetical protein